MTPIEQSGWFANSRRWLAASLAIVVFALGLFAVNPILHEQLHHDAHSSADDGCAIVLFANGLALPLALTAPLPPAADWCRQDFARSTDLVLASPRYWLQPALGPPLA